ncbi:serine/threonine-protein kinase [Streptomyces sp. NPDC102395]|uniref:serine/threonine-protein kinase n=1 Tax=Streptomyces sp. NPDC102395 TaxID=3366168 RepID=UPI0038100361
MRLRESARALASRCSADILAGRYRLDARIGSGGAADVYRGFDLRLRRAVAVKVFRPGTGIEPEEGFSSEAVILARLQHPGLVTAYDAGRHDDRAYLVMQLVEGSTLKARIAEGALSPRETAELGADLARALAHAHAEGVVHRDVKPSNILLSASNRPYLTDFGISRLVDATTRTVTGTIVGTAAYLSPEQVLGEPVGRPADIYALGLVLIECLTGRLEYDGGPLEAAIARLHRPPVLPSALPNELAALLGDMTARDERTRPSALECARTLASVADRTDPSALAAPTTRPTPTAPVAVAARGREPKNDDATHQSPHLAPIRPAPHRPAPARSRVLAAGGTVALVTAMAAALAVTDVFPNQRSDEHPSRAVSSPAEKAAPDGSAATTKDDAAAAQAPTASSPLREASGRPLHEVTPVRNIRATSDGAGRSPAPHGASHSGAQNKTKTAAPGKSSDKSQKAEKAQEDQKVEKAQKAELKSHAKKQDKSAE